LPASIVAELLDRGLLCATGRADQSVRGGAPALEAEHAIRLFADIDLVARPQTVTAAELDRQYEPAALIESGFPTELADVGRISSSHKD